MGVYEDEFIDKILLVAKKSNEVCGTELYEQDFLDILDEIRRHPEKHSFFKDVLRKLIDLGTVVDFIPVELIQFILRYFRWDDIKQYITNMKEQSREIRMVHVLGTILEVYDEFWEDYDLFDFYSKRERNNK